MKLKRLLKSISVSAVKGPKDIEITGICAHSKLVAPGNLFIAKKGTQDSGYRHIPEALAAGAVAIATDIYDPSLKEVTQIIHPDVNGLEGDLAAEFYHHPSHELFLVGLTGTNGKTTTSFLVKHILESRGESCGLVGTIEYCIGPNRYAATRTTPDVTTNHKILREMLIHGCQAAVMEVTSHGLDQGRTRNITFDVAAFTNLSQDHLDYHETMERYAKAKSKLFSPEQGDSFLRRQSPPKVAVVNADDPAHKVMISDFKGDIITFGLQPNATLYARNIKLETTLTTFEAVYQHHAVRFEFPLIGRFNLYNCLTAMGVGLAYGCTLEQLQPIMAHAHAVPGRLQAVQNALGLNIYVDYAHTPDALVQVLNCLNEVKKGRIFTVFGCGGDRDRTKRPLMGTVVNSLSDYAIITTDNPRNEDPQVICEAITKGFSHSSYEVILDRREAISRALSLAQPNDIILIAGKGHETAQIFSYKTIEFDDRRVAAELCRALAEDNH